MFQSNTTIVGFFFILGVIPMLVALLAYTFLLLVPAWQIFFFIASPWTMVILLMCSLPILGAVNLPLPFFMGKNQVGLNLLGVLTPWVFSIAGAFSIAPRPMLIFLVPFVCSLLIYAAGYRFHRRGILISSWWINCSALTTIVLLHIFLGSQIRMVMWWGFVIQYFSVLTITLFSTLKHRKAFIAYDLLLTIGDGGQRNALWAGPSAAVVFTYLLHRFWWGMPQLYSQF